MQSECGSQVIEDSMLNRNVPFFRRNGLAECAVFFVKIQQSILIFFSVFGKFDGVFRKFDGKLFRDASDQFRRSSGRSEKMFVPGMLMLVFMPVLVSMFGTFLFTVTERKKTFRPF